MQEKINLTQFISFLIYILFVNSKVNNKLEKPNILQLNMISHKDTEKWRRAGKTAAI